MADVLSGLVSDKATCGVQVSFTDEDGIALSPTTLTWTLTDGDGTVVNSRQDVSVSSPSSTETIVLSGDDLKYSDGIERVLILEGTYSSDLGTGLSLKHQIRFFLEDILTV
ncbi:MAG: hypothetical protein ACTSYH_03435 [Candidatus Heimdallarchaeaceae archaeon]